MRPPARHSRLLDWPERLAALIEERRHQPFEWGRHDCVLFAADAVRACTGLDPAAQFRGTYASEVEAEALLALRGGLAGTIEWSQAERGAPACLRELAQRGDTALVELGNTLAMGVVLGTDVAVPGPDSLVWAPLRAAHRVWVT